MGPWLASCTLAGAAMTRWPRMCACGCGTSCAPCTRTCCASLQWQPSAPRQRWTFSCQATRTCSQRSQCAGATGCSATQQPGSGTLGAWRTPWRAWTACPWAAAPWLGTPLAWTGQPWPQSWALLAAPRPTAWMQCLTGTLWWRPCPGLRCSACTSAAGQRT